MRKFIFIFLALLVATTLMAYVWNVSDRIIKSERDSCVTQKQQEPNNQSYIAIDDELLNERMLCETSYLPCPKDIDRNLYEMMLMNLDVMNVAFDIERYWRCSDVYDIAKLNGDEGKEELDIANSVRNKIESEIKNYAPSYITNKELRMVALNNMYDQARVLEYGTDSNNYNQISKINEGINQRIRETEMFKQLPFVEVDNDKYFRQFMSLCKSHNSNYVIKLINGSDDKDNPKYIKLMQDYMDSGKYSQWLPMLWIRWRFLVGWNMVGMSKDCQIPNSYFNEYRMTCFFTILRYLKEHPNDYEAKTAAAYMIAEENICIYGNFPYGNQFIMEDYLYKPSND